MNSVEEAVETGRRVGYPIMVKASEGGGGKGIRKCNTEAEVEVAYSQVRDSACGCYSTHCLRETWTLYSLPILESVLVREWETSTLVIL